MTWEQIVSELCNSTIDVLSEQDVEHDFVSFLYLNEFESRFFDNILYAGSYSDFEKLDCKEKISVFLYLDKQPDSDFLHGHAANMIGISDYQNYKTCFHTLRVLFKTIHTMDGYMQKIASLVSKNANLQDICDLIAEIFGHPVTITNTAYSILCSSDNFKPLDQAMRIATDAGFIPTDVLKKLQLSSRRIGKKMEETIVIRHLGRRFKNYNTLILSGRFSIGELSIFYYPEEEMSSAERSYLPKIANQISIIMQRKDFYTLNKGNYYTQLLATLLENPSDAKDADWEERISLFGYHMYDLKYIFVANIEYVMLLEDKITQITKILSDIIGNCIYMLQENQIIFFSSYDSKSGNPIRDIIRRFEEYKEKNSYIRLGVSTPFYSLKYCANAATQAMAAITTGKLFSPNDTVFQYDHYRLKHMVRTTSQKVDLSEFCLPQLFALREYDAVHQSELLRTLYIWTSFSNNSGKACRLLNIHKNTLYFRKNKIVEITHLDLESPSIRAIILISFILFRLDGHIDWDLHEIN